MKKTFITILFLTAYWATAQIPTDYVAYYPLDNNANDLSTNMFNGTVYNAQPIDGAINFAYHFDGYSSKILTSNNNRNVTNIVTVSAWVRTTQNHYGFVVGKYDWMVDKGYHLAVWNNGHAFIAGRNTSNSYAMVVSQAPVTDGKWHHILGIVNGNTWQLYVDCQLQGTYYSTANTPDLTNNEDLAIGYYPLGDTGNHRYFDGDIDEVYVYNRELTINEIHAFCTDGIGAVEEANSHMEQVVKILPNPAGNHIKFLADKKIKSISIFDNSGKYLFSKNFDNYNLNINLQQFEKGIYLVKILFSDNKIILKKIIKN